MHAQLHNSIIRLRQSSPAPPIDCDWFAIDRWWLMHRLHRVRHVRQVRCATWETVLAAASSSVGGSGTLETMTTSTASTSMMTRSHTTSHVETPATRITTHSLTPAHTQRLLVLMRTDTSHAKRSLVWGGMIIAMNTHCMRDTINPYCIVGASCCPPSAWKCLVAQSVRVSNTHTKEKCALNNTHLPHTHSNETVFPE